MDKLKAWQHKYPYQFDGLDKIINSFSQDEINKITAHIYEYESTGSDPSTYYMLIPQNHTVSRLACVNLFEEIYDIKCENMVNNTLPEISSLEMLMGNKSIPRHYILELTLTNVKNKFEVEAYEPY